MSDKIGAITVIMRFHNLAARAPRMADLEAVTNLMIACDTIESRITEPTAEEVCRAWQCPSFCMSTDSWVIVTNQGKFVGYADVRQEAQGRLVSVIRVHPEYRGRGIGTLLVWLVEDRARQLQHIGDRTSSALLAITISSQDEGARQLLEREGYAITRHFWRLVIDVDEVSRTAQEDISEPRKLTLDLVIDSHTLLESAQSERRTGMYVAHQYDIYEKDLLASKQHLNGLHKPEYVNA